MYTLYASLGCGSAAVEAAFALAGVSYSRVEADPWIESSALDALRAINPLAQVPTLVLPDGSVLTESVAILIWLGEQYPDSGLLPAPPAPRAQALRYLVFLAANHYGATSVHDFPERWLRNTSAQEALKAGALSRLKSYWSLLERDLRPSPFVLGNAPCALDLLLTTMSHWHPGRQWLAAHCPKLYQASNATITDPRLKTIWSQNFDQ
jgi:GST-like protein